MATMSQKENNGPIKQSKGNSIFTIFFVGAFLGVRQIYRSSFWTNFFIILIMLLTFLNLVVINGILVGLIDGSSKAYRKNYSGDIFIKRPADKSFIKDGAHVIDVVNKVAGIDGVSPRYVFGGTVVSNFTKIIKSPSKPNQITASFVGISPEAEDRVTGLSSLLAEGEYLSENDTDSILIGSNLLEKYSRGPVNLDTLKEIETGKKVKVSFNNTDYQFEVKGVVKSKISEVSGRIFINDKIFKNIIGRKDGEVNEIAIKIKSGQSIEGIKNEIIRSGVDEADATVQTWEESQGKFFKDVTSTFNFLGLLIGFIGLIVSSITIFIIIFINAISRRKFIGILKGIGVSGSVIEVAYIIQSLFYSITGTLIGIVIVFGFLKPYFNANPINFPFSDGILAVYPVDTAFKVLLLLTVTTLAGYIPSRMIVKQNTLDSILGRK